MMVGRASELAVLESTIADARAGRARRIAVLGDAGIGKTTLLEAVRGAAVDARVLSARGVESEAELPFGALLDLLRPLAGGIDRLPAPLGRALRRALGMEEGPAGDRFAVGAATLSLLAEAAEDGPLLVLVDDLQWSDQPSREAILFAARRLDADRVAVVVALRREDSIDEGELVGFERLEIHGLELDAVAELVGASRAEAALRLTGGNPLALTQVDAQTDLDSTTVPIPLPRRVSRAYSDAIGTLPADARMALLVAAADDEGYVLTIAVALDEKGAALAALEPAELAGLISVSEGRVEFVHPLVRSAAYHGAPAADRRAAHAALARAYSGRADPAREAWHLGAAALGPDETAATALEALAEQAHSRAAYATAARAFGRAADLSIDPAATVRRLHRAAAAGWSAGRAAAAAATARRARDITQDPVLRAEASRLWARIATAVGVDPGEVCAVLEADAEAIAAVEPDTAALLLAQAADRAFFGASQVATSERLALRAHELAGAARAVHPRVDQAYSWHLIRSGDHASGIPLMRQAIAGMLSGAEDDPGALVEAIYMHMWVGDLAASHALAVEAEASARSRGDVSQLPEILCECGAIDTLTDGDWDRAAARYDEALRLADETGQASSAAYVTAALAQLMSHRGDRAGVESAVARLEPFRATRAWCDLAATSARASLALAEGAFDEAVVEFPPAAAAYDTWWGLSTDRIEALIRLGRLREADEDIERATATMTMPLAEGRLDRCRGLAAANGQYTGPLERSIETFTHLSAEVEAARSRLVLGELLRRGGRRIAAREQLRAALDVFERTGCRPWANQTRRELTASGERRRRRQDMGDELTPQERQIALLVAEGRTNREVATLVFLSPKTIEAHLSRVYRKLGITSRADLAARLQR